MPVAQNELIKVEAELVRLRAEGFFIDKLLWGFNVK